MTLRTQVVPVAAGLRIDVLSRGEPNLGNVSGLQVIGC